MSRRAKKSKEELTEIELGNIWAKINAGLPIEHLSINEVNFLCKFYSENWKRRIMELLNSPYDVD